MINLCQALPAGNAVRIYLTLPSYAAYSRLLRKTSDTFSGPTDPAASVVVDTFTEGAIVDIVDLVNGTTYYYHAWNWVSGAWADSGPSFSAIPATTYIDDRLDPQELVRDRVQLGIAAEVLAGNLFPPSGVIQVTTAPFALAEGITFPTISVHLESTGPAERGIGDSISDYFDVPTSLWDEDEGWLARFSLTIAGVSLNPDERISLRKALRRVIQANLPIFADAGLALIEFQQTDSESFQENNAPLYLTNGAFSCIAPSYIRTTEGLIADVVVTEIPDNPLTGLPYP